MDKPRLPGFTGASSLYRHGHYPGITQSPAQTRVLPQYIVTVGGGSTGYTLMRCDCSGLGPFCYCEPATPYEI
jgi:hypothetical protein